MIEATLRHVVQGVRHVDMMYLVVCWENKRPCHGPCGGLGRKLQPGFIVGRYRRSRVRVGLSVTLGLFQLDL